MIPANTPLLYEVELIEIEDKIDVKQGFESIDLDGDKHITLEEVSNKNAPPLPWKKTKQTKYNPLKNSYWIIFESCFFKERKKKLVEKEKKFKKKFKYPPTPIVPNKNIKLSRSFNY